MRGGWSPLAALMLKMPWFFCPVPRAAPRNMRVFDATTNSLTIGWDHAEGPVRQYKISYAPMTGDPITEYVRSSMGPWIMSGTLKLVWR